MDSDNIRRKQVIITLLVKLILFNNIGVVYV